MRNESDAQNPPVSHPIEDARDLLARLYREIGVFAVATELNISTHVTQGRRPSVKDIPAILRGEDKAA